MDKKEVFEAGLDSLKKITELKANMLGGAAERLEAMAKVVAGIPWDEVSTLSIGWDAAKDENYNVQFLPTLNVNMKDTPS